MKEPLCRNQLAALWLLYLSLILPAASTAATPSPDLHARIEQALRTNGLTGAVWSLVHLDGTTTVDAAGVKNTASGERLSADDQVHVGSVTKTLIAAGVLRLITEGRLALETPVTEVLRNLPFHNPWAATHPMVVRHLLDHTAGLDDARLWQIFTLRATADVPLQQAFARDPALLRVRYPPGARLSYSNMGYALLGMVIESVTGKPYESYLDSHLLEPLGMRDSTFSFVSQVGPQASTRLAMGHFDHGVPHPAVPNYLRTPMQFTTTAKDMAAFSRFLMSDGRIRGAAFIDATLLQAMGRPATTEAAQAGLAAGYALGLGRRDRYGVVGRCHVGNTVGYFARLCIFPERQQAFFIAVNTDSETADYGRLEALLVDALDLNPAAPMASVAETPDLSAWNGIYIPAPNRFASFEWLDMLCNFVHVSWDGTRLHLRPFQASNQALIYAGASLFRAADRTNASHVLLVANGKRVLSDGYQSYERTSWFKMALLWGSLVMGLCGVLYILVSSAARLISRDMTLRHPILAPFVSIAALLLPIPLFLAQSFVQLGDITAASLVLALVTGALPAAMLIGLAMQIRQRRRTAAATLDSIAMLAALQLMLVLAAWRLVPLRLWA